MNLKRDAQGHNGHLSPFSGKRSIWIELLLMFSLAGCYDLTSSNDPAQLGDSADEDSEEVEIILDSGSCDSHYAKGCDEDGYLRWLDGCGGKEEIIAECGENFFCQERGDDATCVCNTGWFEVDGLCTPCDCDTSEDCCALKCNPFVTDTVCDDGNILTIDDACSTEYQCVGKNYCDAYYCNEIPPTSQRQCYNDLEEIPCPGDIWEECEETPYCGQDYQWAEFAASRAGRAFTVEEKADTIVIDSFGRQLYWEQSYQAARGIDDARAHCQFLSERNFAEFDDWRVPDVHELISIVNYGLGLGNPEYYYIYQDAFPLFDQDWDTDPALNALDLGIFWSDTPHPNYSQSQWAVDSVTGGLTYASPLRNSHSPQLGPAIPQLVRCVRGALNTLPWPGPERFVPSNPEEEETIIRDLATGLEWQGSKLAKGKIWGDVSEEIGNGPGEVDALEFCQALSYGGRDDWRLPSLNQLGSLISFVKSNNPVSDFPGIEPEQYWTSTTFKTGPTLAWIVNFNRASFPRFVQYKNDKAIPPEPIFSTDTHLDVICVRDPAWDE